MSKRTEVGNAGLQRRITDPVVSDCACVPAVDGLRILYEFEASEVVFFFLTS